MKEHPKTEFEPQYIVETYGDTVYKIAFSQMKNKEDAEDIFQDVFLRFVRNEKGFAGEEHVKAWLIRVTINCCKSHFRSSWFKTRASLKEDIPYLNEEDKGVLEEVLKLPQKYRTAIHLFYYEDLSIEEIANITKIKVSTIKSHLFRGREMLKETLKGVFE